MAIGVIVLLPPGLYFLVRAVKELLWAYAGNRKRWDESTVLAHLATDVATGTALTIFTPQPWFTGSTATPIGCPSPNHLRLESSRVGNSDGRRAGLITWFIALTFLVRFMPHRLGSTFFRLVNAVFSFILLAFATLCVIVVFHHLLD